MTMFSFQYLRILCASVVLVSGLGWQYVAAQGNPFAPAVAQTDPTDPTDAENAATVIEKPVPDPAVDSGTRLIIRAIDESNPQTVIELAKALQAMIDINQPDQARYYLAQLQAKSMDDVQRFEIYETLGTDFFLQLHAADALQPEGSTFAKQVLNAARTQAISTERLNDLIKRLSDQDRLARSEAFRTLRRLGPVAVAEMIHLFTDSDRQPEFPYVRAALAELGTDALPPLLGAARAPHLQVQAEAIRALGHYRSAEATDVMMRTYLSPKMPESLRRVALDSLMKSDRLPADPGYVEDRFFQRSQEFLLGRRQLVGGLSGIVTLWHWDDETKRLVPREVSTATALRIAAAERAEDLYEIRPNSPRNRAIYLLTQLEAAKRIAGPGEPVDIDALMQRFPDARAPEIESVLVEALKLELVPAATACCEWLGEIGSADLVYGGNHQARPLVQAMQLGDRHLQFASLQALEKLDPQRAYAGSSYVLLMAVYMAGSDGQAAGLVGHIRSDMAQTYAAVLQETGLFGRIATNSRQFFNEATHDSDLAVLLVTDTLDKPDYAELLQHLRKDLRTKRVPIGLLVGDMESSIRIQRIIRDDPFLLTMPISLNPQQVASQVRRLEALADPWPVTALDRGRHASLAMKWLNRISNDRPRYRFYDLGSHQEALARLVYKPGFAEQGSQILVNLGTPAAQRELLNFANQSHLPIAQRKQAAAAFSEAIEQGGTLLTRDDILNQYDRYNASESEPVESQQVLGSILDAMEAHSRGDH